MGIGKFLGIGKEIAGPVDAIGGALDKLFTSDDERLSRAEIMEKLKQEPARLQSVLDQLYANSTDLFSKRVRPFCVYVAGLNAFQLGVAVVWCAKGDTIPAWYVTMTTTGFLGALGIYGALRTFEKITGKTK